MDNNNNKFNVIQLNVNSIRSIWKRQELNIFLKKYKPQVLLLNETKLNSKHKVTFKNYNFIRNDRPNNQGGGGTGILVRKPIKYTVIGPPRDFKSIECTIINVPTKGHSLIIASIYVSKEKQYNIDTKDLDLIFGLGHVNTDQFIFGGDFNSHHPLWLNNSTNTNGNSLYNWYLDNLDKYSITIKSPLHPSRHLNDTHTYLDFFFTSSNINVIHPAGYSNYLSTIPFESDHDAVLLTLSLNDSTLEEDPITITNFSGTNWKSFNKKIDQSISQLELPTNRNMTNSEIDNVIEDLSAIFQNTIDTTVPKIQIHPSGQIPLPNHILRTIKYKNKLRRIWHNKSYNCHEQLLKSQINCLNVMIRRQTITHYEQYYQTKFKNIRLDNNVFKNIKRFSSYKARESFPNILTSNENDQETIVHNSISEKANALGAHFESIHSKTLNLGSPEFTHQISSLINSVSNDNTPLTDFSNEHLADTENIAHPFYDKLNDPPIQITQPFAIPGKKELIKNNNIHISFTNSKEVESIIKSKNNKKSFGPDGLPNYALRKMSQKFFIFIAILFNQIFNNGYWPKGWKNAYITPLLKPGKWPENVDSYRPIALLCCLSKIFETIIFRKMLNHCMDNLIIPDEQFGFRPGHSTTHALTKLLDDITRSLNDKTPTIGCSLDCAKAFDTAWIDGLIYKLKYLFGFHPHIVKIILNFLSNRTFQVKLENNLSETFKIQAGFPQGSVLSPLLYILYISDLPNPRNTNIKKLIYADDIFVYLSSKKLYLPDFNNYLNQIYDYLNKWKIKINFSKCESIIFQGTSKSVPRSVKRSFRDIEVKINNNIIPQKNVIKYLGIILSKDLKFIRHIDYILNKTFKAFHSIKSIMKKKKGLSSKIKIITYKQLLRPILTYAFPIWHNISSAQMERLRLTERKYIRTCLHMGRKPGTYLHFNNKILYKKAKIDRMDRHLIKQAKKYFENIFHVENNLISTCLNNYNADYCLEKQHKSPLHLKALLERNLLYDNQGQLTYYHRRLNPNNNSFVYNLNQNT